MRDQDVMFKTIRKGKSKWANAVVLADFGTHVMVADDQGDIVIMTKRSVYVKATVAA